MTLVWERGNKSWRAMQTSWRYASARTRSGDDTVSWRRWVVPGRGEDLSPGEIIRKMAFPPNHECKWWWRLPERPSFVAQRRGDGVCVPERPSFPAAAIWYPSVGEWWDGWSPCNYADNGTCAKRRQCAALWCHVAKKQRSVGKGGKWTI